MEGLRKLENVQKIIQIMESHAIITDTHTATSLRFLADLTLLLTKVGACVAYSLDECTGCPLTPLFGQGHIKTVSHLSMALRGLDRLKKEMLSIPKEQIFLCVVLSEDTSLLESNTLAFQPSPFDLNIPAAYHPSPQPHVPEVSPCCELDIDAKCQLIIDHVPKFSHAFFEEALQCTSEQGVEEMVSTSPLDCGDKIIPDPSKVGSDDLPMIGLEAMQRANSTLEDFCRSYFMFHKMDPHQPQSIFKYLPILSFTESYIYQLDNLNEKLLQPSVGKDRSSYFEFSVVLEAKQSCERTSVRMMTNDPFSPLCILLQQHGLLTARIREEFSSGVEYWSMERKLCRALGSKQEISVEDVMTAIHLKSFDYRVLNLLLYQLRGEKVNDMHMEFLSTSELLVEISDDLFDYEDDVLENSFNILRMFSGIYGASAAPAMLAKVITEAEEKYDSLLKALDPDLSQSCQKRCEEATKEGGKTSGPSLGTWSIPPVIEDEDHYRSNILNSKPSTLPEWNT